MKTKAWRANATLMAVCAGLAGVMCGCGDDTVGGTSGEAVTDSGASDAPVDSTVTTPDTGPTPDTGTTVSDATVDSSSATADTGTDTGTAVVDSSTHDTGIVDSSSDAGAKDVSVADVSVSDASDAGTEGDAADGEVDAGPTLCDIFNNEYLVGGTTLPESSGSGYDWLVESWDGPANSMLADGGCSNCYDQYSIGYSELVCASDAILTIPYYGAAANDSTYFQDNGTAFIKRVFGCPDAVPYNASLGYGGPFGLVPLSYTGPLTKGDLDTFVSIYVTQIQAVFTNHGVTITPEQVTEMTTLLQASESLYPTINTNTNAPTEPVCNDLDAGN
ncbi:MAG TPA: hypothetical protein VK841_06175 [Polyangiaceae bacterium]|nr:hypothetical protein [Polyangiaceae bacterium]